MMERLTGLAVLRQGRLSIWGKIARVGGHSNVMATSAGYSSLLMTRLTAAVILLVIAGSFETEQLGDDQQSLVDLSPIRIIRLDRSVPTHTARNWNGNSELVSPPADHGVSVAGGAATAPFYQVAARGQQPELASLPSVGTQLSAEELRYQQVSAADIERMKAFGIGAP